MAHSKDGGSGDADRQAAKLLIGRPVRVVIAGMPLSGEPQPDRVNIVVEGRTIRDIWFG